MRKHLKLHNPGMYVVFWCMAAFFFQIIINPGVPADEKRVVIIRSNRITAYNEAVEGFKEECERENISINDIYDLNGDLEDGKKAIKNIEISKPGPDLIFAVGILAATLAKERFTNIPIIFCMVILHERFNLQGPNITGISLEAPLEEQFTILEKISGKGKNVGVIYGPENTGKIITEAFHIAERFGFNLITREIRSEKEVAFKLKELIDKIDVLWIVSNITIMKEETLGIIIKTALRHSLPTFCNSSAFVRAGVLASISPDYKYTGYQAARLAQTLLNSPKLVSLGVRQPDKVDLFLNIRTANTIGIDISSLMSMPNIVLCP